MKVVVYVNPKMEHQKRALLPFAESIDPTKHSVDVVYDTIFRFADLFVMWGCTQRNEDLRKRQADVGKDCLIAEAAAFGGQLDMVSMGFNGSRGEAEYIAGDEPAGRAEEIGLGLAGWCGAVSDDAGKLKKLGAKAKKLLSKKKIYIIGQVPSDSTLRGVDYDGFVRDALGVAGKKGVFRKHPKSDYVPRVDCEINDGDVGDVIDNALCVVTMTSTLAVEAVIYGVPVVAMDPRSMAYAVAGHSLEDMKNPVMPERAEWLLWLAYTQYGLDELADGTAWKILVKKFDA